LYWFQSHSSLSLGMVIKWFPLFLNMDALSCMICMVGSVVFMSVSGLHSLRCIWTSSNCSGSCMYLVSLDCILWEHGFRFFCFRLQISTKTGSLRFGNM
jgi:hypothetical protein